MIEKELKYLLAPSDYHLLKRELLKRGLSLKGKKLTNYYFDTPAFDLLLSGVALRLRNRENQWELTYKCRIKGKLFAQRRPGVLISEELNVPLHAGEAQELVRGEKRLFSLDIPFLNRLKKELEGEAGWWERVRCLGHMEVKREKTLLPPYRVPLELDEVRYEDGFTEYELESETDQLEMAESVIGALFRRLDIPPVPSPYPKIVRFFLRKDKKCPLKREWEE
ncbi:CYTH domain-containing protein [Candidatus Mcinerneyibacteriota bacterium]|nr:CYTH domain-containing protein [Candidatus Mcinerneyibacteriota bacterium]